ncbi:MAG: hypothetical protein KTR21_17255 [Rhodobacteraceae bacterium]|nr:hypothetical protein [Paracoccaceae bacterium]
MAASRHSLRRGFWAVAALFCVFWMSTGVSACSGFLELEEEDDSERVVDASFQRHQIRFESGYRAEIAMALREDAETALLCVALGHDAAEDGISGDEAIENWLRLRRLQLGGENLVADLDFAPVYDQTELDGVSAACVEVRPSVVAEAGERIHVGGPKRAYSQF